MQRYVSPFLRGDILNKTYRLCRPLGVGGLGDVWEAEHCQTQDRYALKLLQPRYRDSEELRARLNREFAVLQSARHPNVVLCHGRGEVWEWFRQGGPLNLETTEGLPFLVLELVEGENLQKNLKRRRTERQDRHSRAYALQEATKVFDPILQVLEELHQAEILHRDLKPGNIVLDSTHHRAKLLDWNLGKVPGDQVELTTVGHRDCGSPPYCSPEQLKSLYLASSRSDVYSIAAVLAEALTGVYFRFFLDSNDQLDLNLLEGTLKGEPWPSSHPAAEKLPRGSGPTLPASLVDTLVRALSPKPTERYETVRELRSALSNASLDIAQTLVANPEDDAATQFAIPRTPHSPRCPTPITGTPLAQTPEAPARQSIPSPIREPSTAAPQPAHGPQIAPSAELPLGYQAAASAHRQNERLRLALAIAIGALLTLVLTRLL